MYVAKPLEGTRINYFAFLRIDTIKDMDCVAYLVYVLGHSMHLNIAIHGAAATPAEKAERR
jgi:hypothetical protein